MKKSIGPNWRELDCPGFPPRVNHASICDYEHCIIYSSGGYYVDKEAALAHNPFVEKLVDIYQLRLRLANPKWERIYPRDSNPDPIYNRHTIPRHGHSMALYKRKLFLIGGNANDRITVCLPALLSAFNLDTLTWEKDIKQIGHIPLERDTHACCQVGSILYMHGGIERSNLSGLSGFSNELYSLDLDKYKWTRFSSLGCGEKVHMMFHTLTFHENKLYAFGGECSGPNSFFSSNHNNLTFTYNLESGQWSELKTEGTPPAPRRSHIGVKFRNNLVVFGGACSEVSAFYNDIFFLNLQTNEWTEVVPSGKRPIARRRCGYCMIDNNLYIFGGITPHPDTVAQNTLSQVFYQPLTENMIDLDDTHVLSLDPSLKILCILTVLKYSLHLSPAFRSLPSRLQVDVMEFIVDNQNENIIAGEDDFVSHKAM